MRDNKFFTKVIAMLIAILMCVSALPSVIASELNAEVPEAATTSDCAHVEEIIPAVDATCAAVGFTEGVKCSKCGIVLTPQTEIPKLQHEIEQFDAKAPTYTDIGWEAYEACKNCDYSTFVSIPALGEPEVESYEEFLINLAYLEEIASLYVQSNPGKDPVALIIKYIRTGVDRYNSGSWGIMAGYEDAGFAKFVKDAENAINAELPVEERIAVTGLKNINNFDLPNGDRVDFGHMFGMMDIAYHNKGSENHADVGGWAGDLVDLLTQVDRHELKGSVDEMVKEISKKYLCVATGESDTFGPQDMYGDLDGYYMIDALNETEYEYGAMTNIMMSYFTEDLNDVARADYFLDNRLDGVSTRTQVRNAVYNAYTSNKVVGTLEGTRDFLASDLSDMRRACCYAFADYICRLAGDFVDVTENPYYSNFNTTTSILAPGVTQEINYATSADGKQMIYYLATADLTRDDVNIYANYNNDDPTKWAMARVLDQANFAQEKYGNPDSEHYIENYNVIASINGDGYNMATGEPGGLLVMKGVEYHSVDNGGFFAILKDGTAMIGTRADYDRYKSQIQEGIGGFGTRLVENGEICISRTDDYYSNRAPRTAVGITKTGKVVFMVLDGRQEPLSCGGSMEEIAQIMREAGCVEAVNLDGGGSTTFVARQEGADELTVMNSPSDGSARSVSTSLMIVSTAPSSTAFDHARLDTEFDYATVGTPVQITPVGISATGNIAELPEGCTWAVSDSRWGTVTEDGVFTGLRNGSVDVYLMHGDTIVGVKTMNMVVPANVYFTRETMDAVYGEKVTLPVAAAYEGKRVAISTKDVVLSMNADAGVIDGFTFTGNDGSGVRVLKVTAALATDESIAGSITLNLYKQGENSFDFDQATGGDRLLAFDRVVSNSTTNDNITYVAVDTNKDMVTSYTFAMDMTQIPIPAQLQDLIYMLPGADMENASAWNFLLQLAERVSVLTEVKPVIKFDPNYDVDYSELKILTDYFELTNTEFDESTNTLTMTLNWIDRTTAIDPATANPLCLVSGIKLTPKDDANWDAKNRLNIVNSGEISYRIYLRASALYSFALKPENQQIYGLQPFVNPNLTSEKGAYFSDIYKKFDDNYTLENALKDGWYSEEGGFAYYSQGVKYYDVREVDGFFYDFGSNGINVGQTKYTGIFHDPKLGGYCHAKAGVLSKGWQLVDGKWHFFSNSNGVAVTGRQRVGGIHFDFDSRGMVLDGTWIHTLGGVRYYYGPSYYMSRWQEIDGNMYYFRNGYRVTGYSEVVSKHDSNTMEWHDFGEDGIDRGFVGDGLIEVDGTLYNIVNGRHVYGLTKFGEDYYFFNYSGGVIKNMEYYAWATNCDLPCGNYHFGADGKMLDGVVYHDDGSIIYYENGKTGTYGLVEWEGDYYFVYWGGVVKTGKQYASTTYCDLPKGEYLFGDDGKMLQGVVYHDDGSIIYYENGKTGTYGLVEWEGDYYFVYWGGVVKTGKQYVSVSYCDLPKGEYIFGDDGKMLQGIVYHDDGSIIYYENGKTGTCGLIEYDGDYYYVYWGGVVKTGKQYASITYCDLPKGEYIFGDDGKMLQGVVYHDDGSIIYYENGKTGTCGLIEWEGDYYYVYWGGVVKTGKQYASITYCDLPKGEYIFGDDGKMLQGVVQHDDGSIMYYVNGKTGTCGLIEWEGNYYYVYWGGVVKTGSQYVSITYCDLPVGTYEFGADGKMLDGIVEKDGQLVYYQKGKTATCGLTVIDGDYYYVYWGGVIKTGKQYVSITLCDLPKGEYVFGEDGKLLDGFVNTANGLYYYTKGKAECLGIVIIDGYLYFISSNGRVVTNQTYYAWKTNDLVIERDYVFDELGRIVA
ncbi:MAG: phosphodiester glycosidase family protein [Ruminococcus sp.]|nr:phosphodiester glycosidase family protein [Ruminococcus sp.]